MAEKSVRVTGLLRLEKIKQTVNATLNADKENPRKKSNKKNVSIKISFKSQRNGKIPSSFFVKVTVLFCPQDDSTISAKNFGMPHISAWVMDRHLNLSKNDFLIFPANPAGAQNLKHPALFIFIDPN